MFISLLTSLLYIFCTFHAKYFKAKSENFWCFIVINSEQLSKKGDSPQKIGARPQFYSSILILNFPSQSLQVQSFCSLSFLRSKKLGPGPNFSPLMPWVSSMKNWGQSRKKGTGYLIYWRFFLYVGAWFIKPTFEEEIYWI